MMTKRLTNIVLTSAMVLMAFIGGNITGYMARPVLAAEEPSEFTIFWEAWDIVSNHFVDQDRIDVQAMTYGAIQGMLDSLGDQNHTIFFPPDVAAQQASALEGSFEGIGAYVNQEDGLFTIVAPIHGSPAEAAGILSGDVVLAVDGADITGVPEWEVISMIRGPSGTPVVLTVLHAEEKNPVDIEIIRGRIELSSVYWAEIPELGLTYLQINQFTADTNEELNNALNEIAAASNDGNSTQGILLDLRNNPGGFLQQAILVGSQFLDEGDIILQERDASGEVSTYRSVGDGLAREYPLVVLTNESTASAGEILAGALQENGRARLVGETTLGTGTVLWPFQLSDGSVIRLGVTNWLTPKGNLIKDQGVQPDFPIAQEQSVRLIDNFVLEEIAADEIQSHNDRQFRIGLTMLRALIR